MPSREVLDGQNPEDPPHVLSTRSQRGRFKLALQAKAATKCRALRLYITNGGLSAGDGLGRRLSGGDRLFRGAPRS